MSAAKARILIVEDEPIKRSVMEDELREAGYEVVTAANPLEAEPILVDRPFDVVLTDLRMPGQNGIEFLRELKEKHPEFSVIVMTAYGTVETAVEAMKLGAFDYIQKPFSTEELLLKLDRLFRFEGVFRENEALRLALAQRCNETRIVGESEAIREVLAVIHAVSGTDMTVLITGESGTGKELAARVIHETSYRARGPFVALSCAALPKELVEAELFGHEPGAFTGAHKRHLGRFELAHGGTLFLDDVDDIPLELQVKLLRVLQERCIERVGGERMIRINVRVIAATKKDLPTMVAAGQFREDLFYRLNVVPLGMPALRDRLGDIPLLVDHFLRRIAIELNRGRLTISKTALAKLQRCRWPGNVRQIEHVLERMVALSRKNDLDEEDVPELTRAPDETGCVSLALAEVDSLDMVAVLAEVEGRIVQWAVTRSQGNLAKAAEMLRIPRSTLQYKLAKLEQSTSPRPPQDD